VGSMGILAEARREKMKLRERCSFGAGTFATSNSRVGWLRVCNGRAACGPTPTAVEDGVAAASIQIQAVPTYILLGLLEGSDSRNDQRNQVFGPQSSTDPGLYSENKSHFQGFPIEFVS
jgi:hypothetical protein